MRRKLLRDGVCRVCDNKAEDPHHIVYRSIGGDDVEDNIVGLCNYHHQILHFSAKGDYWETRFAIGETLTDNEVRYAIDRLGVSEGCSFLRRAYGVAQERLDALSVSEAEEGA